MPGKLREILGFLVFSNIYLSFGASVVAWLTLFVANLPFDIELLFIPFAGGMFIYNLNRQTDTKEDRINVPERMKFGNKYGNYLLGGSFVMYLAALYIAFLHSLPALFIALLPGIIASFYSIKRLKKVYFFKNVLVGLSWGVTPLLVGFYNGVFSAEFLILSVFFAVTFFVNTVIFDIKDMIGDSNAKVNTIPIKMGIQKTRNVCYASNILALIFLAASMVLGFVPIRSIVLLLFSAYVFYYVFRAEEKRDGFFYGVLVDGEFVFLYFILLALTILHI
jgi:4-hydroxybenzoate polyprenyltransferase